MINKRLMYIAIRDTLIGLMSVILVFAFIIACFALLVFLIMLTGAHIVLAVGLAIFISGVIVLLSLHVKDRYYRLLREERRKQS